jgi:DNA-directed RNA polymerase specialized sigma24 family protein
MTPAIGVAGRLRAALATTARAARLRPIPTDMRRRIAEDVSNLGCQIARDVIDLDEAMGATTVAGQTALLLYELATHREIIAAAKARQRVLLRLADEAELTDEQLAQVCGVKHQAINKQRQRARER